jgi:hypothetical protein
MTTVAGVPPFRSGGIHAERYLDIPKEWAILSGRDISSFTQ